MTNTTTPGLTSTDMEASLRLFFLLFTILLMTVRSTLAYRRNNQNLVDVPSDIPVTTTTIDLSYNDITSIDNDPFHQLVNLVKLTMNFNDISSIGEDVLCETQLIEIQMTHNKLTTFPNVSCLADTLITVDFNYNRIASVDQTILEALHQLKNVQIEGTYLQMIPDFSFKEFENVYIVHPDIDDFTPHLYKLRTATRLKVGGPSSHLMPVPDFRQVNNMSTENLQLGLFNFTLMPADVLNNMTHLFHLTFFQCDFDKLPSIHPTTTERLQYLQLSNNENYVLQTSDLVPYTNLKGLYMYNQDVFEIPSLPLPSLQHLTMYNGQLPGTLTRQTIKRLFDETTLKVIRLDQNQITGVENVADLLCERTYTRIILQNNPIVCDCTLNWVAHLDSSCGEIYFGDLHPCQVEGQTLSPEWMNNTLCPSTETIDTTTQQTLYNTTDGTIDGTTDAPDGTTYALGKTTDALDATTVAFDDSNDGTTSASVEDQDDSDGSKNSCSNNAATDWFVTMISTWNEQCKWFVLDGKLDTCGLTGWSRQPWYHIRFPSLKLVRGIKIHGK